MHHGTWVTHVQWCMSGSLTRGGGENVAGIPGPCATRNFTYLARGPWDTPPCSWAPWPLTPRRPYPAACVPHRTSTRAWNSPNCRHHKCLWPRLPDIQHVDHRQKGYRHQTPDTSKRKMQVSPMCTSSQDHRQAPWILLGSWKLGDVISKRVGNLQGQLICAWVYLYHHLHCHCSLLLSRPCTYIIRPHLFAMWE